MYADAEIIGDPAVLLAAMSKATVQSQEVMSTSTDTAKEQI